jgi:hypothetical protein
MYNLSYYQLENINNYQKWYDFYNYHLNNMYKIFIKSLKNNNIKYKYNIDNFTQFCKFVYTNTSKKHVL